METLKSKSKDTKVLKLKAILIGIEFLSNGSSTLDINLKQWPKILELSQSLELVNTLKNLHKGGSSIPRKLIILRFQGPQRIVHQALSIAIIQILNSFKTLQRSKTKVI